MNSNKLLQTLGFDSPENQPEELSPSAESAYTANIIRLLSQSFFLKLGDALADVRTVFTWVFGALGVPPYLTALLVPVRESGSLIPQFFMATLVKRFSLRKHVWLVAVALQAVAIGTAATIALSLQAALSGWLILAALAIYSIARSASSISSKDLLGKLVEKNSRGNVLGISVAAAGIITITAALFLAGQDKLSLTTYACILLAAFASYFVAAIICHGIREEPGREVEQEQSAVEFFASFHLLKSDENFRNFVLARSLLLSVSLAAPYFIILIQSAIPESSLAGLPSFMIASGVAALAGGPIWGRLSDRSSRMVMMFSALLTAAACLSVLFFTPQNGAWFVVAFFIQTLAHQGARLGRQTYVVNLGTGNKRTDYVAISNGTIGVLLLVFGLTSSLLSVVSVKLVLGFFAAMALLAAGQVFRLKEV